MIPCFEWFHYFAFSDFLWKTPPPLKHNSIGRVLRCEAIYEKMEWSLSFWFFTWNTSNDIAHMFRDTLYGSKKRKFYFLHKVVQQQPLYERKRGWREINYILFNIPFHLRTVAGLYGQLLIGKHFNHQKILSLLLQSERLKQQTAVIHRGRCCATPFHRVLHFRWIGEKCIQLPRFCRWNPQSSAESSLFSWVCID